MKPCCRSSEEEPGSGDRAPGSLSCKKPQQRQRMSLLNDLTQIFGDAFEQAGLDGAFGTVVVSQRPDLGQFQCNGALPAANAAGRPPREIAQDIVDRVESDERFGHLSLAGPGFINISLTDDFLGREMQVVAGDARFGVPEIRPLKVLVDYGGPNVAKEMHVGHLRATIIGDSLRRIARFLGHDTLGDAHFGDWGTQMGMLIIEIARLHPELPFFDPEFTGEYPTIEVTLDDLEAMYPLVSARCAADPEEAERARIATVELQQGRAGYRALWQQLHDISMTAHRRDFASLGVEFDLWHGESTVHDRIDPMIERLNEVGVAKESDGALVIDIAEPDDKTDMPPFLVAKSDGGFLYSTTDLATVEERVDDLDRELLLYVVDARQSFHFDQVFRAARRSGIAPESVGMEHIKFGTMNGPDGKPFQTRKGGVLKLRDSDRTRHRGGRAETLRRRYRAGVPGGRADRDCPPGRPGRPQVRRPEQSPNVQLPVRSGPVCIVRREDRTISPVLRSSDQIDPPQCPGSWIGARTPRIAGG